MSGSSNSVPSKVVFVGNIPFDKSEEDMSELFSQAGPLKSFRLVLDKDSLKPKGFGFAEYFDVDTAKSAVRNLNESDIGGRKLRVNFADDHNMGAGGEGRGASPEPTAAPVTAADIVGAPLPPGVPVGDAISKTVDSMTRDQKLEVLASIKALLNANPNEVRALLLSNPQLAYSVMLMMTTAGIVDPAAIQRIVMAANPAIPAPVPIPVPATGAPTATGVPMPAVGAMPPMPPMPTGVAPSPAFAAANQESEMQRQLLAQVLSLTPQQIEALPPDQKATVLALVRLCFGNRCTRVLMDSKLTCCTRPL
ncbi:hypothetical protein BCR44DRAFT_1392928 [Catenaria anguillulae PL171]|uniref:RRM domain-containing protein n=1 Tax=Catenaria anguillulae PL171 TaxID=765915 RepID=A0A1Y2H977_9FUNG|nr:hypothetical protein BCR44DRAFT_1392928 [Catenaria anguillulae PL171]